jgi:peptidoglycan/LPS O-acetylase OafA/YrhL
MSSIKYKSESATINYLRGLASLGVVIYHVREDLWIGWNAIWSFPSATVLDKTVALLSIPAPFLGSGVILFFLLSGFCIALPYVGNNGRSLDLKEYAIRRFFRIYPPYLSAIVLTFIIELVLQHIQGTDISSIKTYLVSLIMIQNYTTGPLEANGALWTLPIEFELYITFPLVFYILNKFGAKVLIGFSCLISLSSFAIYLSGVDWLHDNFAIYWLVWNAGALLAKYYADNTLAMPSKWVIFTGVASLCIALVAQTSGVSAANLEFLYGYFYLILLWFGLTTEYRWDSRIPKIIVGPLTILGTCSYSLYLIHKPLFRLWGVLWTNHFGNKPVNFLVPLMFVVLMIGISWGFYHLIESPSHRLAKTAAKKWFAKKV